MSHDEMARQSDAGQWNASAASNLDVDDRQEDRQAASSRKHDVEHRVVGIVVALAITGEPVLAAEQLTAGEGKLERTLLGLADDAREICAENVEPLDRGIGIDDSQLGGHGQRQDVHLGSRLCGQIGK